MVVEGVDRRSGRFGFMLNDMTCPARRRIMMRIMEGLTREDGTLIPRNPCQAEVAFDSFDDPSRGHEFVHFVVIDDLDYRTGGVGSGLRDPPPMITGIGEDAFDKGEEAAGVRQSRASRVNGSN
jgi:hypothetical protein